VFVRSGGVWTQQQELTENGAQEDYFGWSVSVSGDTALIATPGKSNINQSQGAAFVFVRNGDIWARQQKLTAADGAAADAFGSSVSLNGDTALIGAYKNAGSTQAQGAVYVLVRSGGVWTQQQELTAADGAENNEFGVSTSLSGNSALIGASGTAYVFVRKGEVWTQQQQLTPSDGTIDGYAVSLSGSTAVLGGEPNSGGGAAYVFVQK
jgi:hypothetical protein